MDRSAAAASAVADSGGSNGNSSSSRRSSLRNSAAAANSIEEETQAIPASSSSTSTSLKRKRGAATLANSNGGESSTLAQDTASGTHTNGTSTPEPARRSLRSSARIQQSSSSSSSGTSTPVNPGPSAKALGKRRAVSPPSAPDQSQDTASSKEAQSNGTSLETTPASKRRRLSTSSRAASSNGSPALSTPSSSPSSYNLRPRGSSSATSTSTSRLNPANQTTPATASKMPRKGKAGGAKSDHSTSLRAKAAANAAAASATAHHNSGSASHANAQGSGSPSVGSSASTGSSSKRNRHAQLQEEMMIGGEGEDDGLEYDEQDEQDDEDDMQLIGGVEMDLHGEGDESIAQAEHDDDDMDEDDDQDEIYPDGGEDDMLEEGFDVPITYDADGNAIIPGMTGTAASTTGGTAGGTSARAPNSSSSSEDSLGGGSGSAAAAAAAAAAALENDGYGSFAASLRGYSGMMAGMSSRLSGLLKNLRNKTDSSVRMIALQELSELLSMSTEDTLAGYFSVDAFVKELVSCLKGGPAPSTMGMGSEDDDFALAQAIAMSAEGLGGAGGEEGGDEMQLLACRCLANLIEAMPSSAHNIVSNGAVPVLCSKLFEITFIDLAEQTISTLEKLSEEMPNAIVREGGLSALLTFLDFFSTHVQRTALTAAANCCHSLSVDAFSSVRDMMPVLRNVLTYSDRKLVEQACLAITGVVDSYRHHPDKLEALLTGELLTAVAALMVPGATNAQIDASTHPKILKLLSTAAKSSPEIAMNLIEMNIANTIYQLLTGVSQPSEEEGIAGIRKHLQEDDMLVLNNLVHRSKDVVQETLNLVHGLMPALPKDGIFDPRAHMHRSSRSKVKKETASTSSDPAQAGPSASATSSLSSSPQRSQPRPIGRSGRSTPRINDDGTISVKAEEMTPALDDLLPPPQGAASSLSTSAPTESMVKSAQEKRTDMFENLDGTRKTTVERFFALLLPILLDVYSASVGVQVRSKTFQNMLKIVHFCSAEYLPTILTIVPMASFLASCYSSKDQPQLVIDALQMTELLLVKVPDTYQYYFRREGVMFEIEKMAEEPLLVVSKSKKGGTSPASTPGASNSSTPMPGNATPADDGGDSADLGTRIAVAAGGSASSSLHQKILSSTESLQKDAITLRAKHLRKMLSSSSKTDGSLKADSALHDIRTLVEALDLVSTESKKETAEEKAVAALQTIAGLFGSAKDPMSSFEMQESGLIGGLLRFATEGNDTSLDNDHRRRLIMEAFMPAESAADSPLTALVKRLQEALGRAEEFDVLTALPSGGDSRSNPATMLARQLKMRLVASDNSGIPRTVANVVVSIHAIATFSSFNDYLRPRVASALAAEERSKAGSPGPGSSSAPSSRLSGMLAAFAAATGMPPPDAEGSGSAVANLANALSASAPPSTSRPTVADSGRRRSSRLSAKNSLAAAPAAESESASSSGPSSLPNAPSPLASAATAAPAMTFGDMEDDDEDEDDILEGELANGDSVEERLINFEVASDGSRVNASTPDGTRVQTPIPGSAAAGGSGTVGKPGITGSAASTPAAGPSTSTAPPPGRSYAAALKAAPADWHLQFSMGGRPIDMESTIFGAVYQHEVRSGSAAGIRGVWQNIYTVNFKKVAGPPPTSSPEGTPEPPNFENALPDCLSKDPRQATMLRLLGVLHQINSDWSETLLRQNKLQQLEASAAVTTNVFVNNKLTAKLNRQLEEPMIVASNCLPDWAVEMPRLFPFLFPFETRYAFLQSTAFGYARLMQKWLQSARDAHNANSRRDENLSFLGRLQRQKVRISRQRLLESAMKVFELYGGSKAMLEVEYFDEVGTGLGPTLEFYSLVSKEFRKKSHGLWRGSETSSEESEFVHSAAGLFPSPVDADNLGSDDLATKRSMFKTLGMVVAKALMDSRIVDIPFSKMFMKIVLNQHIPLTIASVKNIDPTLAKSLEHLEQYVAARVSIENDASHSAEDREKAIKAIKIADAGIEDLSLDFTLPGYDIELKAGGKDISVDMDNLNEYIRLVIEWTLLKGIKPMISKFKEGFNEVFAVADLHTFTPEELVKLFGDEDEDWSFGTITEAIKADHGYSLASNAIVNFVELVSSFDKAMRRKALSFFTGASRLPVGGFQGLNPQLTIVRKIPDDGLRMDDVLPSVMTCANFIKLPEYSSKEIMEERLLLAIEEGGSAFHLS